MDITEQQLKSMLSEAYESGWCGVRELNEFVVDEIISKNAITKKHGTSIITTGANYKNFVNSYTSTHTSSQGYYGGSSVSWSST